MIRIPEHGLTRLRLKAPFGTFAMPFVRWLLFGLIALETIPAVVADDEIKSQDQAVIRAPAGQSEIVITTTPRVAGAIHSLTWNGKEFIDSFDHGRQLQSAA